MVDRIKYEPKVFFNYVKYFPKTSSTIDVLVHDGKYFTHDTSKANILDDLFASVTCNEPPIAWSLPVPAVDYIVFTVSVVFDSPQGMSEKCWQI